MWKLFEIQIPASINEGLLEHSHPIHLILSVAAFVLQQQGWVVVTEPMWPSKPKVFANWPVIEKVCWPLGYIEDRE